MTDCRMCKNNDNCVYACDRIEELNEYDDGIIYVDDNKVPIDPYMLYSNCDNYEKKEN